MRKNPFVVFTLGLLILVGVAALLSAQEKAAPKPETITGTLVDLKCYAAGGFLTNDHGGAAGCGTACAKGGLPVALVDANKKVHILGVPAPAYADWVGKELRLTGKHAQHADVFIPDKVEAKEGDKWIEQKAKKGMM